MSKGRVERLDRPSRDRRNETPEAMRVWMLGGFRVSVGSQTMGRDRWRLRKAASLVKLLAIAPGHRIHREQAMNLLWPELGRKAASNNLRRVLHAARKILDPAMGSLYLASQEESLCCLRQESCGWTQRHSRGPHSAPADPETLPPTGRPSNCTQGSSCPTTATSSGRRTSGGN